MPKKEHLYVVVETVIEAMVPMIIQIARRIVAHVLRAVDDSRFRHGGDQGTESCANEALTLAGKAVITWCSAGDGKLHAQVVGTEGGITTIWGSEGTLQDLRPASSKR